MAKVLLNSESARELEDLPLVIHVRVLSLLERLADWPSVSGANLSPVAWLVDTAFVQEITVCSSVWKATR